MQRPTTGWQLELQEVLGRGQGGILWSNSSMQAAAKEDTKSPQCSIGNWWVLAPPLPGGQSGSEAAARLRVALQQASKSSAPHCSRS